MSQDVVAQVKQLLRTHVYRFQTEEQLHEAIGTVLAGAGIAFERERALEGCRDRLDFYLPEYGVAIEVKAAGAMQPAIRQCERYLNHADVRGLVLAASRHWAFSQFGVGPFSAQIDKPFTIAYLVRPL